MKRFTAALLAFCVIAISSCKKNDGDDQLVTVSSMIFGKTMSFRESSVEYYKLTSQEIYKDSIGLNGQILFSAIPLSQQKHSIAKPLLERFPVYLKEHPNQTFGCPNCLDQGMIYLETTIQGVPMKWYIDPSDFPAELTGFINELHTTIEAL